MNLETCFQMLINVSKYAGIGNPKYNKRLWLHKIMACYFIVHFGNLAGRVFSRPWVN